MKKSLQYQYKGLMAYQCLVDSGPVLFIHYHDVQVHAVVLLVSAAAREGQGVIRAGDGPDDGLAHFSLIHAEKFKDPSARIVYLRLSL